MLGIALVACGQALAVDYAKDIKPLLKERCYACHGALKQKAGLRLDTVSAISPHRASHARAYQVLHDMDDEGGRKGLNVTISRPNGHPGYILMRNNDAPSIVTD